MDDSGEITSGELALFLEDPTMSAFFRMLGFDIADPQRFITLLDADESGFVTFEEFLEGCMQFKGVAQGVDVHAILRYIRKLAQTVEEMSCQMSALTKQAAVQREIGRQTIGHSQALEKRLRGLTNEIDTMKTLPDNAPGGSTSTSL